jgi:hypothetical protein
MSVVDVLGTNRPQNVRNILRYAQYNDRAKEIEFSHPMRQIQKGVSLRIPFKSIGLAVGSMERGGRRVRMMTFAVRSNPRSKKDTARTPQAKPVVPLNKRLIIMG